MAVVLRLVPFTGSHSHAQTGRDRHTCLPPKTTSVCFHGNSGSNISSSSRRPDDWSFSSLQQRHSHVYIGPAYGRSAVMTGEAGLPPSVTLSRCVRVFRVSRNTAEMADRLAGLTAGQRDGVPRAADIRKRFRRTIACLSFCGFEANSVKNVAAPEPKP